MSSLLSKRRRPETGPDDLEQPLDQNNGKSRKSGDRRPWIRGRRGGTGAFVTSASTRVFLACIAVSVVAGPAALVISGRPTPTPAAAPAATALDTFGPGTQASAAGTRLVRSWLSAGQKDRDQLAAQVMTPPDTLQLSATRPPPPSSVVAADVANVGPGEWRVLIEAQGGLAGSSAFYLVLIRVNDTGAVALALPARVSAPAPSASSPTNLTAVPLTDPASQAVQGFTTALLTGAPDLSRWISPDSTLQPGPKACQTVALTKVLTADAGTDSPARNGTQLAVLANVNCTVTRASDRQPLVAQTLQYPLVLRARDGRWEVVRYSDNAPGRSAATNPTSPVPTSAAAQTSTSPTSSPTGR